MRRNLILTAAAVLAAAVLLIAGFVWFVTSVPGPPRPVSAHSVVTSESSSSEVEKRLRRARSKPVDPSEQELTPLERIAPEWAKKYPLSAVTGLMERARPYLEFAECVYDVADFDAWDAVDYLIYGIPNCPQLAVSGTGLRSDPPEIWTYIWRAWLVLLFGPPLVATFYLVSSRGLHAGHEHRLPSLRDRD